MFTLKLTKEYDDDLQKLPSTIRENQINKTHEFLQLDPRHNSLNSKKFKGFTRNNVFRSRVNDNYRIAWFYGSGYQTIVLWHVGPHKLIDSLDSLCDIPHYKISREITAQVNKRVTNKHPLPVHQQKPPGIFYGINPNHLRLFGVPEDKIDLVREITDYGHIYDLGLPKQANEFLLDLYTTEGWSADHYLDIRQILYRENADRLEQYCKGKIKRLMLDLTPEQENIVHTNATGTILIKGVAGSGKTTVGVYRALHLSRAQRLFSTKPVLFLTYTETLTKVVAKLFYELTSKDEHKSLSERISAFTVRDWCVRFLNDHNRKLNFRKAEGLLSSAITKIVPKDANYVFLKQESFIKTEIDQVIKGRGIKDWKEYRHINRIGRGQPLQQTARRIIWDVYQDYQKRLIRAGIMDEGDLALESLLKIKQLGRGFEPYPEVVIDEAQDLTPKQLELAAALAGGGESRGLCLLADPSQSIYYKGISWRDANVIIYGARVKSLTKNFRNPKPILDAAWALSKADPQHNLEEAVEPALSDRPGFKPRLHYVSNESDQDLKKMKDLILRCAESNRYRLGDIAVLCRTNDRVRTVKAYLKHADIPVCHFREDHFDVFENDVKAITFHSAKGLEFPIVILMNLEEGVIPRGLDHIENAEDLRDALRMERKLLYVCMTRASEELCMIATKGKTSRFLKDIPDALIEKKGKSD